MDIRRGDQVILLKVITGAKAADGRPAGKEKAGEQTTVLKVFPESRRVLLEGVRIVWKHQKPNKTAPKGAKIQKEAPIDVSNVMLVCPACSKPTRVAHKRVETSGKGGRNERICKKCKAVIEPRKA